MSFLINKNILLGVTGSIAAYKSADLVRRLREASAHVRVAMSQHAQQFITPLTMQALSGNPVHTDLFDLTAEAAMGHIELARWADIVIIAPASANFIAKLAYGFADDLLNTLCLATKAPIFLAPAMNQVMWQHPLTQTNLQRLRELQCKIIGPAAGDQACGDVGFGRMSEPNEIVAALNQHFGSRKLIGKKVLITAGPTHEAIDPIRYLTNGSTGKMGYALAEKALAAGADVTLISGPVNLAPVKHAHMIYVKSAEEMLQKVMEQIQQMDIFIAVAAVSDYRSQTIAKQKIHKDHDILSLTLEKNPDILATVAKLPTKPFLVGFAAETDNIIQSAKDKLQRKQIDLIVANQITEGLGMGSDENEVTVLSHLDEIKFPRQAKTELALALINLIADKLPTT